MYVNIGITIYPYFNKKLQSNPNILISNSQKLSLQDT